MFCPNCGKDNNPFAKYCEDCGAELPEVEMQLSDDEFVAEEQELKVSQAAPMSDAVKHSGHIGNMPIEDLDGQETFEPQMLSFNTQGYNGNQANLGYRNPLDTPIVTAPKQIDDDGFVPGSAFANLKPPKQKKSKLRIALIIFGFAVILGIASFFIVKYIIESVSTRYMREHTSEFIANSYYISVKEYLEHDELLKVFSPESQKRTVKVTGISWDKQTNSLYFNAGTEGTGNDVNIELYSNADRNVLKYTAGNTGFDYYMDSQNIRQRAETSVFGTKGENIFGISQEQYDNFMTAYEYIYEEIKKSGKEDYVSDTEELLKKVCADIDKSGKIEIKNEEVSIEGEEAERVYLITHTFEGKEVLNVVYSDLKTWAEGNKGISGDMRESLFSYIEEINTKLSSIKEFEMKVENYINKKDNSLMQTVIYSEVDGEKSETRIYMGTNPAKSKKIMFSTNALKSEVKEDSNQSSTAEANGSEWTVIELERNFQSEKNEYTLICSMPDREAKYVLSLTNSNSAFTLESTVKTSSTAEPVTTTTDGIIYIDNVSITIVISG